MSPSFARIAPTYAALRPLSAEDRARLEAMLREAAVGAGDLVVEVGCGTGRLTLPMAGVTPARGVGGGKGGRPLDGGRGTGGPRGRGGGAGAGHSAPAARRR